MAIELNHRFIDFARKRARYKITHGGRSGGKSHNVARILLLKGKERKLLIVCLRHVQKNLTESVYRLMSNCIREDKNLSKFYRIMSDKFIGKNGTEIVFSGIKYAENFKSFEAADIAWVEEASQLTAESMRILTPTIRKYQSEIWFTFNPSDANDPVYRLVNSPLTMTQEELDEGGYEVAQINLEINYYDNPHCPSIMKTEAKRDRILNPDDYEHTWLGKCRVLSDNIIFKGKFQELEFEVEDYFGIPRFKGQVVDLYPGLDFGWVHPTAIIEQFKHDGAIYIWNEIVGSEMDCDDITTRYINEMPWCRNKILYADSARPDLIDTLKNPRLSKEGVQLPGLMIEPANKGAGSVESGITWMKTCLMIYIHPRCVHTLGNFKKYAYKKDKNDVIVAQIVKLDDDCIDASRYGWTPLIGEDSTGINWGDEQFQREISTSEY